jgi:hypothetical protein
MVLSFDNYYNEEEQLNTRNKKREMNGAKSTK